MRRVQVGTKKDGQNMNEERPESADESKRTMTDEEMRLELLTVVVGIKAELKRIREAVEGGNRGSFSPVTPISMISGTGGIPVVKPFDLRSDEVPSSRKDKPDAQSEEAPTD